MPGSANFPNPRKTILTGNPRQQRSPGCRSPPPQPVLRPGAAVVMWRSHGALKLNEAFAGSLRRVDWKLRPGCLYHGRRYYEELNRS